MRNIFSATLALALLSLTGIASAQYDRSRDQRDDRYNRDRYDRNSNNRDSYDRNSYDRNYNDRDSYDRRGSSAEQQRNSVWRELFARQEDERREFYRCTPYRQGSREYCRALDRIVQRQERERSEMRDRMTRDNRSYRDR